MKNNIAILVSAFMVSTLSFAQQDEMKTLKKIYNKDLPSPKDITDYRAALAKAEPLMGSASESDKVYFAYYKSISPMLDMALPENQKNPQNIMKSFTPPVIGTIADASAAVVDYEKKSGKKLYTDDINQDAVTYKPMLLNYAIELGKQKRDKDAASVLYSIYKLDRKDVDNLYYAATYAVNGQDYEQALKYYDELKTLNYSGDSMGYYAMNAASDKEERFATAAERDRLVALKTHSKPRQAKDESKRGEIYKNIALILVSQDKTDEAKSAIANARKENPDDISLIMTEADLHYKLNDLVAYKKSIGEALEKNPNDATLLYNLGVITSKTDAAESEKFYTKAIAIKPDYTEAYLNLAVSKLSGEQKLVEEMNKLGTSDKDNKRYEVLKKQREDMFKSALPYLEKANELDPKNEDVSATLSNVYGALEMTEKRKALKARMGN